MIYAVGLDTDTVFVHFLREAAHQGLAVTAINLRAVAQRGTWCLYLPGGPQSFVEVDGTRTYLLAEDAFYYRAGARGSAAMSPNETVVWEALTGALEAWLEVTPACVVNRPNIPIDNGSKPLHAHHLARLGFCVPDGVMSAKSTVLAEFAKSGPTVVKAISGVRATTRPVVTDELAHYDSSRGPLHLQRLVSGFDVRAHVVGQDVHAERIDSTVLDYRGASGNRYRAHQLPDAIADRVIKATQNLGLGFAGWDFKVDSDGTYWCLEVNPMPGYYPYDRRLGGRITRSLVKLLSEPRGNAAPPVCPAQQLPRHGLAS